MTTQSKAYSKITATNKTIETLQSAYAELPAAKAAMAENPKARALFNAACNFQAALKNHLATAAGRIDPQYTALARSGAPANRATLFAQLAVASTSPAVASTLHDMVTAYNQYEGTQPNLNIHRLVGTVTVLGR
ncbi:MAG: hypothetical protein JWO78_1160 [Micavibrio sp.]|nr:hypothetical protein [Micavibrio sp.]